jgi:hypothetical protein
VSKAATGDPTGKNGAGLTANCKGESRALTRSVSAISRAPGGKTAISKRRRRGGRQIRFLMGRLLGGGFFLLVFVLFPGGIGIVGLNCFGDRRGVGTEVFAIYDSVRPHKKRHHA